MATLYTITGQRTVTQSVPGGTFRRVVEVYFVAHPSEQSSQVDVPLADLSPATVDAAVTPVAEALNAVQVL